METKLFIGDHRVELDITPSILYSYTVTDYSNPTAVRNGHSKTVTIKGTPNNNKIFGMYWNVERSVGNGGPNAGIYYNASKKAPFKLFVGTELYEEGYVRLDKINRIDKEISYDCTLFSGLGDFFYNLAYNPNTGDKLRLADLDFYTGGNDEFDFTVTATTVNEAWEALHNGTDGKWQHINFMPAYNGHPSDFDADKIIMNLEGTALPQSDETGLFRPLAGTCVIADLPQEMNEWEVRDLRSYLQRPCIRMKSIIDACCDPDQNGGYEVELDPDFFSSSNDYYTNAWLSLPLMQNLEYANQEQVLEGSRLISLRASGNGNTYIYQDLKFDIGEFGNTAPSSINVGANIFVNNIFNNLNPDVVDPYMGGLIDMNAHNTSFMYFFRNRGDGIHNNWLCLGSLFVQLIALNGETVVGASEAYNLTTPIRHNGKLYFGHNGHYSVANQYKPYMDANIYDVLGTFENDGFHREGSSSPATINFHINGLQSPISALKVVFFWGATDDKISRFSKQTLFCVEQDSDLIAISDWFTDTGCTYSTGTDPTSYTVGVLSNDIKAVLGDSLGRSGTKVTKALLLNTKDTPMDYLLSYAKTFGLHFTKVLGENKVKIETRKTFYHRDEVVNLNDYIDRSKDIKINPITFSTKWYELSHEMDETEYSKKYESARGVQYGSRILNTGYEFDVKKENLLDKGVIRSGIEVLERSKYFSAYNNDNVLRSWMGMGLHYNLYFGEHTADVDLPVVSQNNLMGINENEGMKYYDIFPKLQFHKDDGSPTDGNNVLVFFSGFKDMEQGRSNPISYYLSDDNAFQTIYNDGTPCWLFTPSETISGTQICYKVRYIPVFERYLTNNGSGVINKSLDFGTPQELYIPDYSISEDVNIYSNFWQDYLEDLFHPDTKVLECYVRVVGRIGDEWLRRFYWFDNAIWRLNKVTDWEVGGEGLTQMEFIRVQNVTNYNSVTQVQSTKIGLTSNNYWVDYTGETITLSVTISNGGGWRITSTEGAILSRTNGNGNGTVRVTIPINNNNGIKYWYFTATSSDGTASARITVTQSYDGETDFVPSPSDLIIPASGGSAWVNFIWQNQGDEYISNVDFNEGEDYLQFSADTSTYRTQNKALLTFSANTGTTVLHNYCQFQSYNGISRSIGIDQVPDLVFDSSGGSYTLNFDYNSAVTITGPEWVDIVKTGNSFTITARPNYYESENRAELTITDGNSTVRSSIRQNAGSGGIASSLNVAPTNLYFGENGGTQFISITASTYWNCTSGGSWWSVSTPNGSGSQTIGITALSNTGSSRSDTIVFTSNGASKTVYLSQAASGSSQVTISVSPQSSSIAQSGETVVYTVNASDMNGLTLDVNATRSDGVSATVGNVSWQGNVGTVSVTYPANNTYNTSKTWNVSFTLKRGTSTVTSTSVSPTQSGSDNEGWNGGGGHGNGGSEGGEIVVNPTANTCWVTNYGELEVNAISLSTTDGDYGVIDTGIVPNSGYTMRINYIGKGLTNGYLFMGIGDDDSRDWRFFQPSSISSVYFDYNSQRTTSKWKPIKNEGEEYDITMKCNYLYDNIGNSVIYDFRDASQYPDWNAPWQGNSTIKVDVRTIWVKEVWIWDDNDNLVFHGVPYPRSYEEHYNNIYIHHDYTVALYDTVSNRNLGVSSAYTGTGVLKPNVHTDQTQTWFTATPNGCENSTFVVTLQPNNSPEPRWGHVSVYGDPSGNRIGGYDFRQAGLSETLSISRSEIVFDSSGEVATFTINSNTNWTIE